MSEPTDPLDLARFYARLFDSLSEAGSPPDPEQVHAADRELSPHGLTLDRDDAGRWVVVASRRERFSQHAQRYIKRGKVWLHAAARAPKGKPISIQGKTYKPGQFIPGAVVAHASAEDKARIADGQKASAARSAQQADQRTARGPVDVAALRRRIAKRTGGHGTTLSAPEQRSATASMRMLLHHHGGHALHRVDELAGLAESALDRLGDRQDARSQRARGNLQQQLARLHRMTDVAEGMGVKGDGSLPRKTSLPKNPKPGQVYTVATDELKVDPSRFQYKLNTNAAGVTSEFSEVRTFNPDFAGVISVWHDPEDGRTYVVNGHHRAELAKRLNHPDLAVRYVEADTAEKARAVGALVNMAEGRGTAIDAAKFLRDSGTDLAGLEKLGLSIKGKLAEDAVALTRLNPTIFSRVAMGLFDPARAVAIGAHVSDERLQDSLVEAIEAQEERTGREVTPRTVAEMAREAASVPTATQTTKDLFGEFTSENSLWVPRAELKAFVRSDLARQVRDFQAVASDRRAATVKDAGNVLNTVENKRLAEEADRVRNVFDALVNYKGVVSDILNEEAANYASATSQKGRDEVRKRAASRVHKELIAQANDPTIGERSSAGSGVGKEGARQFSAAAQTKDVRRGNVVGDGLKPRTRLEDSRWIYQCEFMAAVREGLERAAVNPEARWYDGKHYILATTRGCADTVKVIGENAAQYARAATGRNAMRSVRAPRRPSGKRSTGSRCPGRERRRSARLRLGRSAGRRSPR